MNKKVLFKIIALVSFFFTISLVQANEYTGTVTPISVETLVFGTDSGWCGYLVLGPRFGDIVKPPVTDEAFDYIGKIDIIGQMDLRAWKAQLKQYEMSSVASKGIEELALINYNRYLYLAKTRSNSFVDSTNMEYIYSQDYGLYMNNLDNILMNKELVASRTATAPYEGIISKLYSSIGSLVGRPAIADITQLNPIGITIKLSLDEQKKISATTPITVYPQNSTTAYGVINSSRIINEDGITLFIDNSPVLNKTEPLIMTDSPVLRDWFPVLKFSFNGSSKDLLSVPETSIQKDNIGNFVWKAVGQKVMQPGKGISDRFKIEKVYVTLAPYKSQIFPYEKAQIIKSSMNLDAYDLVLGEPSKNLKDGETVYYPQSRYVFMPGDKVRVVIGDNAKGEN